MAEPTPLEKKIAEVRARAEALGYRYQPPNSTDRETNLGLFWKRIETSRPCLTNDKDQICFTLYNWAPYTKVPFDLRVEVELVGEFTKDAWANLKVYSLTLEDFFERHVMVERALIRAWDALMPVYSDEAEKTQMLRQYIRDMHHAVEPLVGVARMQPEGSVLQTMGETAAKTMTPSDSVMYLIRKDNK